MPIPPLIPAIISSIIESIVDQPTPPAVAAQQQGPMVGLIRTLPQDAKSGQMNSAVMGAVYIDGRELPLSPAAQIRNQANMIVVPTAVTETVPVRYLLDGMGYVNRIWILTPAELAASR